VETYSVQVFCDQCKSYQSMEVPKGERRDWIEDQMCPNCGVEDELQLVE